MAKNRRTRAARTALDYNKRPLSEGEVLVLMPFNEEDRENINNPDSIVTVKRYGRAVRGVLKAVPKEFEAEAKALFNDWARADGSAGCRRCLVPQPDGSLEPCPRKNGDNRPECSRCPHCGEYEREKPLCISYEALAEAGMEPKKTGSPEDAVVKAEERREAEEETAAFFEELIAASPKHALAAMLMAQGISGEEFADRMRLKHDAAARVRRQVADLAPGGVSRISELDPSGLKANRSRNDGYYLETATAMLDGILEMI